MATVLVVLVGGAMQFYARDLNVRDMEVRQMQLAAAVLQMIEDDLRATLHAEPIDSSALAALLTSAASQQAGAMGDSGATGGSPSGDGPDLSAAGIDSAIDDTSTTETTDLVIGMAVLQSPGLIGNQFQIQFDVSRLPRLEEYMQMLDQDAGNLEDVPSDVKTVTYFVQMAGTTVGVEDSFNQLQAPTEGQETPGNGGLVRRSLDRMATMNAMSTGAISSLDRTGNVLAPEVVSIEFSYWDGALWQLQWNSDEMGELPLAVQVEIGMVDPLQSALAQENNESVAEPRLFNHVIRLPLARPLTTATQVETAL